MSRAIVIGAGVGGLAAGAALQQRGWDVEVYERAQALEAVGAGLAVAPNALKALDAIGVGRRLREMASLQGDVGIATWRGRWLSRTSAEFAEARFGDPTVILHRAALVSVLVDALKPGTLRLGTPVDAGDLDADLVVAADGLRSGTRKALLPGHPGTVYTGVTSWRMLVSRFDGAVQPMEAWGRGCVFGVAPLADGRVYCYATAVAPAGASGPSGEREELLRLFGDWLAPVPALVESAGEVLRTDITCLAEPLPRFHFGRTVLLGDAAHAMTPNLGQGACQAIEDAVVLASVADQPDGLARYTASRLPRTSRIAAQSRRIGRLTQWTNPVAVFVRDNGMWLAGKLGPNVMIRQVDPVMSWHPPL